MKAMKQNFSIFFIMLILLFFLGGNFFLFSQEKTGNISGIVTDDEGNPLPGVTIEAWSLALKETHKSVTNLEGHFKLSNLPPGTYAVTFELGGFETVKKEKIMVQSGQTVHLNATMGIDPLIEEAALQVIPKEDPIVQPKRIKVGLKIGINAADLYGENIREVESLLDEKVKSKLAFCAGGYLTFKINRRVNMQLEILYTKKGSKIVEERIVTYLDYLEIPVLIKFLLTSRGRIKPNFFAGPAFSISLDGKTKEDSAVREWENLKGTDFGLIIGGGLDFGKLMFDMRYNLGLTTISELAGEVVKNRVISLIVGYSF